MQIMPYCSECRHRTTGTPQHVSLQVATAKKGMTWSTDLISDFIIANDELKQQFK